jgi:hypothetical protein
MLEKITKKIRWPKLVPGTTEIINVLNVMVGKQRKVATWKT